MTDKEQLLNLLQNPNIAAPLLAAAGSGLVGGTVSSRSGRRRGETRSERRRRTVRDALLSAGAGGLATAGIRHGFNELGTALPEGKRNPVSGALSLLGIGGASGGASWYTNRGLNKARGTKALNTSFLREFPGGISGFSENNPLKALDGLKSMRGDVRINDSVFKEVGISPFTPAQRIQRKLGPRLSHNRLTRAVGRHPVLATGLGVAAMTPVVARGAGYAAKNLLPNFLTYGD